MRKHWAAVHRYGGLTILVLLFVNALSGSLLAFEHEIDAWLNPSLHVTGNMASALPPDALVARVEQADARLRVTHVPLDVIPGRSYELLVAARPGHTLSFDRLFVDPSDGRVLGQRLWRAWRFDRVHAMSFINGLHRTFHLPEPWGRWLAGGLALAWLLLSGVGAWLSLPKLAGGLRAIWARWMPAWQIKRGAAWQRQVFDVHRAGGLWSLGLAVVLALSGVFFNLGNEVFRPAVRWFSPVTTHPVQALPRLTAPVPAPAFGLQEAVSRAREQLPAAAQAFLPWYIGHLPAQGVYRVAFKEPEMRERAWRLRYEQLFIDDQTGQLKGMTGYDSGTAGDRFLIWQYPLHTGRILGWPGRVLVGVSGLVVAVLCVTGLLLWNARRKGRNKRR